VVNSGGEEPTDVDSRTGNREKNDNHRMIKHPDRSEERDFFKL
jgi:hypothetical protein